MIWFIWAELELIGLKVWAESRNVLRHANDDEVDFEPTIEDPEYEINDRY